MAGPMDIDPQSASTLGFPKLKYACLERERRWLCREVPRERIVHTDSIADLYVTGARLRLREARPVDGSAAMLRLTRKADIDAYTRLITTIYLPEDEFSLLARSLPGVRIRKQRHHLQQMPGIALSVDEFEGELAGLIMAEAECDTPEQLAAFPMPDFAMREVTEDIRFTGGHLAKHGLPKD